MTNKQAPANAGAITRSLKAAGFMKSETHRSGMVRGWADYTEGIRSRQCLDYRTERVQAGTYADGSPRFKRYSANRPTGVVRVEYQLSTATRAAQQPSKRERRVRELQRAAEVLREKGYRVEEHDMDGPRPELSVWREDADGKVVK